jgi:hypothetical protein
MKKLDEKSICDHLLDVDSFATNYTRIIPSLGYEGLARVIAKHLKISIDEVKEKLRLSIEKEQKKYRDSVLDILSS